MMQADPLAVPRFWLLAKGAQMPTLKKSVFKSWYYLFVTEAFQLKTK